MFTAPPATRRVYRASLCTALLLIVGTAHAGDSTVVPKWSVHEFRLTAAREYDNPYLDASVAAEFTGPDGSRLTVPGFWDGGKDFAVRFTPVAEGDWAYRTVSDDPGLGGRTGTLRCVAAADGARGFLRVDPEHPRHFVRDDGSPAFLFGTTYYNLLANLLGGGSWREAVGGCAAHGIDKVRFKTGPVSGKSRGAKYPSTSPFGKTHDRLNVDHFRALDEAVRFMRDRDVVADLILFWNDEDSFGTPEQDERYLTYIVARYAAFPNVIVCLSNEWEYTKRPIESWNRLGRIAHAADPWMEVGGRVRALSIHQRTRLLWQFGGAGWPTHVTVQYGVRNPGGRTVSPPGTPRYVHGDQWGYASIRANDGFGMPVLNDEYGYAGEPNDPTALRRDRAAGDDENASMTREKHRHVIWGIYTAGGYGSTGDKYLYEDPPGRPYFSADWHEIDEYGDIERLVRFFTAAGLRFRDMTPDAGQSSVEERRYVLAEPGRCYVVYAADGGAVPVRPAGGPYRAVRFDPRTGEEVGLGTASGDVTFDTPAGRDWVLRLDRID